MYKIALKLKSLYWQNWFFSTFCKENQLHLSKPTVELWDFLSRCWIAVQQYDKHFYQDLFCIFQWKKNSLHSQKLCEQISVLLYNVLKLISLVQKENRATFAIKLEKGDARSENDLEWRHRCFSSNTHSLPSSGSLSSAKEQPSLAAALWGSSFWSLWHREPCQCPRCARGFQAPWGGLVGNTPWHPCVPGHAGPNNRTHLANMCRAHKTP